MRDIRVAAAQFEHRDDDKAHNLSRIRALTARAVDQGAEIVSFHERAVTGYTFVQTLDRAGTEALAEPVPQGPSSQELLRFLGKIGVDQADRRKVYLTISVIQRGNSPQKSGAGRSVGTIITIKIGNKIPICICC